MLKALRDSFKELFDWKKHPANVFYLAIPLMVIALGCQIAIALLKLREGDPGYLIITACGIALLIFIVWRLRNPYKGN